MKRTLLALVVVAGLFMPRASIVVAEENAPPAAAAPAPSDPKNSDTAGGCMPGGACCGQGACAQAGTQAGSAAPNAAEGGCPCKMKKAQQKKVDG